MTDAIAMPSFLVVDDHDIFRRGLVKYLRQKGCEVFEAATGMAALSLWNEKKPMGIYMDIRLPDMNGIEVAKKIQEEKPSLPIAFMTGEASPGEVEHALGISDFSLFDKTTLTTAGFAGLEPITRELIQQAIALRDANIDTLSDVKENIELALQNIFRFMHEWHRTAVKNQDFLIAYSVIMLVTAIVFNVLTDIEKKSYEVSSREVVTSGAQPTLLDMYSELKGYMDRDEQRELQRR